MRIINREQLSHMPNGTVFMLYTPEILDGQIHIITGRHKDRSGYNGEITLTPHFSDKESGIDSNDDRIINWSTVGATDFDYNADQLFAVFSKLEVQVMIQILQWALSNCEDNGLSWFIDYYFLKDYIIPEKEIEDWCEDLSAFGLE